MKLNERRNINCESIWLLSLASIFAYFYRFRDAPHTYHFISSALNVPNSINNRQRHHVFDACDVLNFMIIDKSFYSFSNIQENVHDGVVRYVCVLPQQPKFNRNVFRASQ